MALNEPSTDLASVTGPAINGPTGQDRQARSRAAPAAPGQRVSGAVAEQLTNSILNRTAELFAVSVSELRGPRRTPELAQARFAAAYALHRRCEAITLRAIGVALGGRNHSTILNALRRAQELAQRDTTYRAKLQALLDEPSAPMAHRPPEPLSLLGRPWWQQSHNRAPVERREPVAGGDQ